MSPLLPDASAQARGQVLEIIDSNLGFALVEQTTCLTDHQPLRLITCRTGSMLDKLIATRPVGLTTQYRVNELRDGDPFKQPYEQNQT